jgi:putative transposase
VSAETGVALATVCRLTGAPRSTVYARRDRAGVERPLRRKRGPVVAICDEDLTELIREVIRSSPFSGEGHRKVTARLRREHGIRVGRKRVLRLMRQAGLLAPQRARGRRKPRPHDGTIIPAAPNTLWGTDATMAYTRNDGWVWAFVAVDHHTAEGWASVAKRGDRFACLEPIYDAVRDRFGSIGPDAARGIAMRHDWGPQYTSGHFQGALRWLGMEDSPAFVGEPPCNGCAERFIRTLKEQCIWARTYADVAELGAAVADFVHRYNTEWLIERHGHRTPREVYQGWLQTREEVA